MQPLLKKPQSAISIVITGFRLWSKHIHELFLVSLIAVIFTGLPLFFIPKLNTYQIHIHMQYIERALPAFLTFVAIMLYLFAALVYKAHLVYSNIQANFFIPFWIALKKWPYLIIAMIIYNIAIMLGLMLLFFPGLIMLVLLSMYFMIIILENENPFSAFKQSWLLITDKFWHTLTVLVILIAIILIFTTIVTILGQDLWVISHPSGGKIWFGHHLLRLISGLIFYPIFCSVLLVLYHDLKLRTRSP